MRLKVSYLLRFIKNPAPSVWIFKATIESYPHIIEAQNYFRGRENEDNKFLVYEKVAECCKKAFSIISQKYGEKAQETELKNEENELQELQKTYGRLELFFEQQSDATYYSAEILGDEHEVAQGCRRGLLFILEKKRVCLMNLGQAFIKAERPRDALENMNKALELTKKIFPDRPSCTVPLLIELTGVLIDLERFDEARNRMAELLPLVDSLPAEDPTWLDILSHMISLHESEGEFEKALEAEEKSLALQIKIFGEIHVAVGITYCEIGNTLKELKNYDLALEKQKKGLEILKKVGDDFKPQIIRTLSDIGKTLRKLEKYNDSLSVQEEALRLLKELADVNPLIIERYSKEIANTRREISSKMCDS